MHSIIYPSQTTYWIIFNDPQTLVNSYGITETTQRTDSKYEFTTYLDEQQWLDVLAQHGIVPDVDEETGEYLL
jgi:hypothetical protein